MERSRINRGMARGAGVLLPAVALALATHALAEPVLDGRIHDVVESAHARIANGACGVIVQDPPRDILLSDAVIMPCSGSVEDRPGIGKYFVNGFDLLLAVLSAEGEDLWLGMRVQGQVGDSDGDGTDAAGVICSGEQSGIVPEDGPGIGPGEHYEFFLDTNCDGSRDFLISVAGGAGSQAPAVLVGDGAGNPLAGVSGSARFAGDELEIHVSGLALTNLALRARVCSGFDGMGEDNAGPGLSALPSITISPINLLAPARFCPGEADWIELDATNDNSVPVSLEVTGLVPDGWQFTGVAEGDLKLTEVTGGKLRFGADAIPGGQTRSARVQIMAPTVSAEADFRAVGSVAYVAQCLIEAATSLGDTSGVAISSEPCLAAVSQGAGTALSAPTPNPFRAQTNFGYQIGGDRPARVEVAIYNVAGRQVKLLVTGDVAPGRYDAAWDGRDGNGLPVAPGMYFVRGRLDGRELGQVRRVLLLN